MKKQNKVTQFVVRHRMGLLKIGGVLALLGMAWLGGRSQQAAENKEEREKAQREHERENLRKEFEEKRRQYEADPKNHLGDCGLVEDDFWDEGCDDQPVINMIISEIPLSKMGELGQEIMKRAHDGQSHGCIDRDDPEAAAVYEGIINENAMCSILISLLQEDSSETAAEPAEDADKKAMDEEEAHEQSVEM